MVYKLVSKISLLRFICQIPLAWRLWGLAPPNS
jgi:hypothetical protein